MFLEKLGESMRSTGGCYIRLLNIRFLLLLLLTVTALRPSHPNTANVRRFGNRPSLVVQSVAILSTRLDE